MENTMFMKSEMMTENKMFNEKWEFAKKVLDQYLYAERYQSLLAEIQPESYDAEAKELVLRFKSPVMESLMGQAVFFMVMYAICQAFGMDTQLRSITVDKSGNEVVKKMMDFHWEHEFKDFDRLLEEASEEDRALLSQLTPVWQHSALNIFKAPQHIMENEHVMELLNHFYLLGPIFLKPEDAETELNKRWTLAQEEYTTRIKWGMPKGLFQEIHLERQEDHILYIKVDSYTTYMRLSVDTFWQYCIAKHFGCKAVLVTYPGNTGLVDISWTEKGCDETALAQVVQKIQDTKELMREKIRKQEPLSSGDEKNWYTYMCEIYTEMTPELVLEVLESAELIYGNPGKLWILEYKKQQLEENIDTYEWLNGLISSFLPTPYYSTLAIVKG